MYVVIDNNLFLKIKDYFVFVLFFGSEGHILKQFRHRHTYRIMTRRMDLSHKLAVCIGASVLFPYSASQFGTCDGGGIV